MSERSISSGIGTIIMEMDTIIKDKELVESKRKQIVRGAIELFSGERILRNYCTGDRQ